jgi:alpha-galactosidase
MLLDLMAHAQELRGSSVALVDVSAESVDLMGRVAQRLNAAAGNPFTFECTTDVRAALAGAAFVIVSVAVDRLATWRNDWAIPRAHGVRQVLGENGGPGGLGHTLRSVQVMLGVAQTIAEVAPDALVLNFTNPLSRICMALARATPLRCVGMCHQIGAGYRIAGQVLGLATDANDARARQHELQHKITIKAAGLNHISWIYDLRDAETGADLYPTFRERLAAMPADFEPLSRRLLDAFGLFPATGDGHAGEYISFAWETSAERGYDFDGRAREAEELREALRQVADGERPVEEYLGRVSGERAVPIISAIVHNRNQFEDSVNIPNRGCIPGLPDWAIVEVPGLASGAGVSGLQVPPLPPAITALLAQQVAVQDRAVHAAIHGDRQAALQALLLDPVVQSYDAAVQILDALLEAHAPYLPQF